MYFVDREKIESTLAFLVDNINLYESKEEWSSIIDKKALERIVHTMIEAVLDVGNQMIDGFIMRDPGSFEDIIDILEDEKVVLTKEAKSLKQVILLRKSLVQEYSHVDHELVLTVIKNNLGSLKSFSPSVKSYLANELGPVSAFRS